MRICLIGKNLTNILLARILANKKLTIDIIYNVENKKNFNSRTIGISKSNFDFLLSYEKKIRLFSWPVKKIKIFNQKEKFKELFEFFENNKENFFLIKYNKIYKYFERSLNKFKNINLIKISNKINEEYLLKDDKYNLLINSDTNNQITKKYFNHKIEKKYYSSAHTCIINHKKITNDIAIQIFTKYGPIAFLPLSNSKTSIVFSFFHKYEMSNKEIINLINEFNTKYKIISFGKIEKADLKFSMLRNYYYKNILSFGDLIHRIHPLAGQGFNMTIRDIKILSFLIDERIELGLELNSSILYDFQKNTKHLNYIFGSSINFIHDFFKLDNKLNNFLSDPIFSILRKNKFFNKYANHFADKGIKI